MLFLVRALFGLCSFWFVPFLVRAVFGSCCFRLVLFLVRAFLCSWTKKAQTKKGTNQKHHKPKRARTKKNTNKKKGTIQKGHEPKTAQAKNNMNQKMHEPKTAQTKNSTNQNETDVTCGKLQYFNQITILYLGIETRQMTAIWLECDCKYFQCTRKGISYIALLFGIHFSSLIQHTVVLEYLNLKESALFNFAFQPF